MRARTPSNVWADVPAVVDDDRAAGVGPRLFGVAYRRSLAANAIGGALAFVYLSFVSPPQPEPAHDERFLFLGVAPAYLVVAALVGTRSESGSSRLSSAGLQGGDPGARTTAG